MTTTEKMLCPECSSELALRNGKLGQFYGCSAYPNCRYIQKKDATKGSVSKENKPLSSVYDVFKNEKGEYELPITRKPTYNPSSQYVSYSKDIFMFLMEHNIKAEPKAKDYLKPEGHMALAIELVKQAIKEFE